MLKTVLSILARTWDRFVDYRTFQAAAALSFYALLSLTPTILIAVAFGGLFFSDAAVKAEIIASLSELIGEESARLAETIIDSATNEESNVASLIIGTILMVIGATTVFNHLHRVLNTIWDVKSSSSNAIWMYVKGRLLSLAVLMCVGLLLIVSLLASTLLGTFNEFLSDVLTMRGEIWGRVEFALSYVLITVLVSIMYTLLPDARVAWRDTWLGAVIASILFGVGKNLIEFYIGQASPGSSFGAAGSVVVFMIWIYYASLNFFLGAVISRECTRYRTGH
jgi:membrane protein